MNKHISSIYNYLTSPLLCWRSLQRHPTKFAFPIVWQNAKSCLVRVSIEQVNGELCNKPAIYWACHQNIDFHFYIHVEKNYRGLIKSYILPQSLSTSILYRLRNASEPVQYKTISDDWRHAQNIKKTCKKQMEYYYQLKYNMVIISLSENRPTAGCLINICTRIAATSGKSYDLSPISSHIASLIAAVWSLIRIGKIPGESSNSRSVPKRTHLFRVSNVRSRMQIQDCLYGYTM